MGFRALKRLIKAGVKASPWPLLLNIFAKPSPATGDIERRDLNLESLPLKLDA
jgi:hypothetical protein